MLVKLASKLVLLQFDHIKKQEVLDMVTIEQVTKLREYADISFEEAKAALEETNGDILEAIVNLEKKGKIKAPQGGGNFTTASEGDKVHQEAAGGEGAKQQPEKDSATFGELVGRFFRWCGRVLHRGNINSLEVSRNNEKLMSIPVTVLVLLLLFIFWITIPLMIIGLFFGYSYRFAGPDLGREKVNKAMESVSEAAENFKKDVKGDKSNGTHSDN